MTSYDSGSRYSNFAESAWLGELEDFILFFTFLALSLAAWCKTGTGELVV